MPHIQYIARMHVSNIVKKRITQWKSVVKKIMGRHIYGDA